MNGLRSFYRQVIAPMGPTWVAAAFAVGMLWENPTGTPFESMPLAEQVASVGFVAVFVVNLAYMYQHLGREGAHE
jgi:hypothetical protein